MIKPLKLEGIVYTREQIDSLCQPLLEIRDVLIIQNPTYAVSMCHIYALMQHLKENTEP